MDFIEEQLNFVERPKSIDRGLFNNNVPQELGIALRLGNAPIVKDLKKLLEFSGKELSPDLKVIFQEKDIYLIVHMIGAVRLKGNAKVHELQYNAEMIDIDGAQTLDLLPSVAFRELLNVSVGFQGSISANGNFSAAIPVALTQTLTEKDITLGGDMKIQLAADANFVGKFTYSLKFPVVQSNGVASTFCTWVLNPENTPLLGDQLLIQTIAVPKNTKSIVYKAKGVCVADKSLSWKKQTMETKDYTITVSLA